MTGKQSIFCLVSTDFPVINNKRLEAPNESNLGQYSTPATCHSLLLSYICITISLSTEEVEVFTSPRRKKKKGSEQQSEEARDDDEEDTERRNE